MGFLKRRTVWRSSAVVGVMLTFIVAVGAQAGGIDDRATPIERVMTMTDRDLTHGQTVTVEGRGFGWTYPTLVQCVVPRGGVTEIKRSRHCDGSGGVDPDEQPGQGVHFSTEFIVRAVTYGRDDREFLCPERRCVIAAFSGETGRLQETVRLPWADNPLLPPRPKLRLTQLRWGKTLGHARVTGTGFKPLSDVSMVECFRPKGLATPSVDVGHCVLKDGMRVQADDTGRIDTTVTLVRNLEFPDPGEPGRVGARDCKRTPSLCAIAGSSTRETDPAARKTRILLSQAG